MNIETLIQRLAQFTVPSTDDGVQFVRTDRLERIRDALDASAYRCLGDVPLAVLYSHRAYLPSRPTILISNHIDSVYDDYFCDAGEATIRGTFDNSAGNAVVVENYFIERQNRDSLLQFARKRDFRRYLVDRLDNEPHFIKNAEPDESWQYDEHDLNCFTFCLPCRVLGSDMHDNDGVAIRRDSLIAYAKALAQLVQAIDKDLAERVMGRHATNP